MVLTYKSYTIAPMSTHELLPTADNDPEAIATAFNERYYELVRLKRGDAPQAIVTEERLVDFAMEGGGSYRSRLDIAQDLWSCIDRNTNSDLVYHDNEWLRTLVAFDRRIRVGSNYYRFAGIPVQNVVHVKELLDQAHFPGYSGLREELMHDFTVVLTTPSRS